VAELRLSDGRMVDPSSAEAREIIRHSTAHVMAKAVCELFPGAKYAIGPAIEDGFYYDFDIGRPFTPEDLDAIEKKMRELIDARQKFERAEYSREEALKIFADQPFKKEIIESLEESEGAGPAVSVYRNGEWEDLCRGPHLESTGRIKAFKLMRVAGAYWRGDEHRPMLQRIYGTAWESKDALAQHLVRLEEAERRDHRKLGNELDLFSFPDELGSGLAVFHPKGGLMRKIMEDYSRRRHEESGYEFVNTPHITRSDLFETSGHLDWFADAMFPPMVFEDGSRYYLKPMNCPFHILIFRSRIRSYRELPIRMFEFGSVYRYEKSGVIHGLTRVRGMTQDDAHIFCTKEQMPGELASLLTFVLGLLRDYGLDDFYLELSTKPEGKALGSDEDWEEATGALRAAALEMGLDLVMDEGGGAFYGPKISVQARDAIGRTWQVSTIQVDFQLPNRFDLHYTTDSNERARPIMIHRALFGSIERFFGILVEHYAGAFPSWLAPVQAVVVPIADRHAEYAEKIGNDLRARGLRADVDNSRETMQSKVRNAELQKVPYILVVGDKEIEAGTVAVRARGTAKAKFGVASADFAEELAAEVAAREAKPRYASA
jgi:threonyl-tRNA synthetase